MGLYRFNLTTFLAIDVLAALSPAIALAAVPGQSTRVFAMAMPFGWLLALAINRGYAHRVRISAPHTARRVLSAMTTFAAIAPVICVIADAPGIIGCAAPAVLVTALLTMAGRAVAITATRAATRGAVRQRALAVGRSSSIADLVASLMRDPTSNLSIVAACATDTVDPTVNALPVPVSGDLADIPGMALRLGCPTVVVIPSGELDDQSLRRLAWKLMDAGIDLIVAPPIAEVVQERVTVTDAGGRLLLHVKRPRFDGPVWLAKCLIDKIIATVMLVVATPVMLVIAILIRMTSRGPAIFRQRRVGQHGREFTCLKFRTMAADADRRRHEVAHLNERGEGLLFKIRNDPRVTPVGSWLRRSSLDELPQLINIVLGDMSLVGPRPPLPSEVAGYDDDLRRRLMVKPGLTGLWQVSGRSELPWPEAIRLDLTYVDNWSPSLDTQIMLRTAIAVIRGTGAY